MIDAVGIFGRFEREIARATQYNEAPAKIIYVGRSEFEEVRALCKRWGHDWPPLGPDGTYMPDFKRAHFKGVAIFVVDAASHLAAT